MTRTVAEPAIRAARFVLAHAPGLVRYGSKPSRDIARDRSVAARITAALRPYELARDYPPNQVLLGALHPDALHDLARPWFTRRATGGRVGPHGEILTEEELLGLIKLSDDFDLVNLERGFVEEISPVLAAHPLATKADLSRLGPGVSEGEIASRLGGGLPALPLVLPSGRRVGCIVAGHEEDSTLGADVLLENLAAKVTAAVALRDLLAQ